MARPSQLIAGGMVVDDFLPEISYNRQRVQGRHGDVDEYPYVTRTK